jgi:hypothetical protein
MTDIIGTETSTKEHMMVTTPNSYTPLSQEERAWLIIELEDRIGQKLDEVTRVRVLELLDISRRAKAEGKDVRVITRKDPDKR